MEQKNYRVSHIPQIPGNAFEVHCETLDEAMRISEILCDYDQFQFDNHVKPNYSNASGIEEYDHESQEWNEVDVDSLDHCGICGKIVDFNNPDYTYVYDDECGWCCLEHYEG